MSTILVVFINIHILNSIGIIFDIKLLKIEGMQVGDKLLDYFSKSQLTSFFFIVIVLFFTSIILLQCFKSSFLCVQRITILFFIFSNK